MESARKDELDKLAESINLIGQSVDLKHNRKFSQEETWRLAVYFSKASLQISGIATEHKILRSLYFESLQARYTKIAPAHETTFDWIFNPTSQTSTQNCTNINFVKWLTSGTGIYWISGYVACTFALP